MKTRYEKVKSIIRYLQTGYSVDRKIVGNERLAFLVVMVVVTKRSIPQTVKMRRNQFFQGVRSFKFRGTSPRAKNTYYICLPVSFKEYLEGYCFRYRVLSDDILFPFNPDYVGNRVRELVKFAGYDISINDMQTLIPYSYNTKQYQIFAFELLDMLRDTIYLETYRCFTGEDICNSIRIFEEKHLKK